MCARDGDVVGGGERRQQVVLLEDEADLLLAQFGPPASDIASRSLPCMWTLPEVGGVRPPRMWNSVDLPEPEGPTMETNSPRFTSRSDAAQRVNVHLADAIDLAQVAHLDDESLRYS